MGDVPSPSSSSGSVFLFLRSALLATVLAAATLGLPFGTTSKVVSTGSVASSTGSTVATSTTLTASSSVLLVASAVPGASSDALYEVDLGAKLVKKVPVENGWRQGKLRGVTVHIEPRATGDVSLLVGPGWNVLLRDKAGTAYQEIQVLGMNADQVILLARKDQRLLLRVSKLGSIEELAMVTETQEVLGWKAGLVWLASFQPGEGIELAPMGPSDLTVVDMTGRVETVLTSEQVVTSVVPFSSQLFAYRTDEEAVVFTGATSVPLPGRPLFWLNQKHLIYTRGTLLFDLEIATGTSTELVSLPTMASEAVEK